MVQVAKEPISTKGPRLTTELTIAGRYMVLVPFSDKVSVSQKIESQEERKRLKKVVKVLSHRDLVLLSVPLQKVKWWPIWMQILKPIESGKSFTSK